MNSRLISSPTKKKNIAIKNSLTKCEDDSARDKYESEMGEFAAISAMSAALQRKIPPATSRAKNARSD
jgi:hypothetical protein